MITINSQVELINFLTVVYRLAMAWHRKFKTQITSSGR